MPAGYSGTPLARKLSLKDGQRVWWDGIPDAVRAAIESEGLVLDLLPAPEAPVDAAHIFVTDRAEMESKLAEKGLESRHRHHRGPDPRLDPPRHRPGRRQGLRRRLDLVGAEADGSKQAVIPDLIRDP